MVPLRFTPFGTKDLEGFLGAQRLGTFERPVELQFNLPRQFNRTLKGPRGDKPPFGRFEVLIRDVSYRCSANFTGKLNDTRTGRPAWMPGVKVCPSALIRSIASRAASVQPAGNLRIGLR